MPKAPNPFDVFKKILRAQRITEQEAQATPVFLLRRWLSGHPQLIPLAQALQGLQNPSAAVYTTLGQALNRRISYIQYPKQQKARDQDVQDLQLHFDLGHQEALDYRTWYTLRDQKEWNTVLKQIQALKKQ